MVIVADDLGWADVSYHGSEIPTPHIDRLCGMGVELDSHYVSPLCTPTRVALLTGRYPSRFGNKAPSNARVLPWETMTLATMLAGSGYETAITGKWHLGSKPDYGPLQFGFERSYGALAGGVGPYNHLYKGQLKVWHRNDQLIDEEGHVTDLIADEVLAFLSEKRERPFFLYVPFTAVHDPFDEPQQYLDTVSHIPEGRRQYAASAVHMDAAIGRIVAALTSHGQLDNTLLVFFSDNGGTRGEGGKAYPGKVAYSAVQGSNQPLRGWKRQVYEGGIRTPAFAVWKKHLEPGARMRHPMHAVDWMPTIAALIGYEPEPHLKWDGRDILPLLRDPNAHVDPRTIYCQNIRGESYVRRGNWKLIVQEGGEAPQLYDLSGDPYEENNEADKHPQVVAELTRLWSAERAKDNDSLPDPAQAR